MSRGNIQTGHKHFRLGRRRKKNDPPFLFTKCPVHSIYPAPTSSISFRLSSWSCDGHVNIGLRALAHPSNWTAEIRSNRLHLFSSTSIGVVERQRCPPKDLAVLSGPSCVLKDIVDPQTSAQAPSSLASRSKAGRRRLIRCRP